MIDCCEPLKFALISVSTIRTNLCISLMIIVHPVVYSAENIVDLLSVLLPLWRYICPVLAKPTWRLWLLFRLEYWGVRRNMMDSASERTLYRWKNLHRQEGVWLVIMQVKHLTNVAVKETEPTISLWKCKQGDSWQRLKEAAHGLGSRWYGWLASLKNIIR